MLNIDTETMLIELTRGDTANIVFSAVDKNGNTYNPRVGDKLKFAVGKKVGTDPMFEIENGITSANVTYEEVTITQTEYEADPTLYFTESSGVYTQCSADDPYDGGATYYMIDPTEFWTITISDEWYEKDEDGNVGDPPVDLFKFKDYVFDVQLSNSGGVDTIIGQTDTISPTFRVLGEVATE